MTNLGTAYVSVMPSMKGFGSAVESGLSGIDTTGAGSAMGQRAATGFAGGMAKNGVIVGAASALATKAFDAVSSSADRAVARVDTMKNFPKVMSNLGISADEADAAIDKVSQGLIGLPTALDSGVAAVQRFTSFNGDVGKSADMFLAVNDAIIAGGSGAQMQASALEQLSQSYTKGKMDIMEWRTLQQAMPAQLKQIADAMGITTEQLGAGLRQAEKDASYLRDISMDEFIGEIMRLDKEGVNGLASFEQQARDATTGINTAMANMETAVVRSVANVIDAFGQETISGGINYLSGKIGEVGKVFAEDAKEVAGFLNENSDTITKLVDTAADIAPTATKAWGAFKLFEGGKAIFSGIAATARGIAPALGALSEKALATAVKMEVAGLKGSGVMLGLADAAAEASLLIGSMSAGAVGLVAGLGIAIVGLSVYNAAIRSAAYEAAYLTEEQQNIVKSVHSLADSYGEVVTKRDEQVASINSEYDNIRALKEEYNGLVDANGQIQEGCEERANTIISELAAAMGVEESAVYDLIDAYGLLGDAADEAVQRSQAQQLLAANEEAYTEAVSNMESATQNYADAVQAAEDATAKSTKASADWTNAWQDNLDAVAGTPEAISYGVYGFETLADTATGAADGAVDMAKAVDEAKQTLVDFKTATENYEGLSAALDSGDATAIEEWSARVQYGVVSAENGTRQSLENQVANFQSSYDSIAAAVEAGDKSMEDDLASMGAALAAAESELKAYDAIELNEKFASITMDDGSLVDAQGNLYTWNGSELVDQYGNAVVDDVELLDAQGNVHTWNGTELESKSATVTVADFASGTIQNIQGMLNSLASRVYTAQVAIAGGSLDAKGGFFDLHAMGGFITSGPTVLGRDRRGVVHIAGEDGREWVQKHADGTTSIVPIENRKYLAPYANVIASMLEGSESSREVHNHYYSINGMNYLPGSAVARAVGDLFNLVEEERRR